MSRSKSRSHPPLQDIITPGPDLPWELIGPGESHLLVELENLYWIGVKHEVQNIIQTLRFWQRPENVHISVPDERDDFIYGFDTFIDQVCQESREFAIRYGKRRGRKDADKYPGQDRYEDALKQAFLDIKAERDMMQIRGEVRDEIKNLPKLNGIELRACMLLQSAGFLDIDKVIKYRTPRDKTANPRPEIPQLTLSINEHSQPEFLPLHCSSCNAIIYDSMFTKQPPTPSPCTICSDCHWTQHYGDPSFVKVHKHSVLHAINAPTSRRLCQCETVPHSDPLGHPRALFPLNPGDQHITTGDSRCPLLDLADMISHAKYRGLLSSVEVDPRGSERGSIARVIKRVKSIKLGRGDRSNVESRVGTGNLHMDFMEGRPADDDIPAFFRHRVEKNPFGEEHMALRIGPLVIENGVESTKSGALITLREPSIFHECLDNAGNQPALAVEGTAERVLWQQSRPVGKPKRYKAMMKQVVGVPFTGLVESEQDREQEIIKLVVEASQSQSPSSLSEIDAQQDPGSHISRILEHLQDLLLPRVRTYLSSIASRLLTPSTALTWNPATNTCHSFCTSLLDPTLFTPLVNGPPIDPTPLYLISFYTPPSPQPLVLAAPKTKDDIPLGHIQEILSTQPTSSDLIDALTHYFTDWASFSAPLYPHQPLFPWDCTEGYARCPTPCGECNLSKHVWAFPFDAWSLVSMHLGKERCFYSFTREDGGEAEYNHVEMRGVIHRLVQHPDTDADPDADPGPDMNAHTDTNTDTDTDNETYTDAQTHLDPDPDPSPAPPIQWIQNRLSILCASWALARASSGMARSSTFASSTAWIHSHQHIRTRTQISPSMPTIPTVKKGGIHRAQPNSHSFELGTNERYFRSPWAGKSVLEARSEYERLRSLRMRMDDVLGRTGGRFHVSGMSMSRSRLSKSKGEKKEKGDRSYVGFEGVDGMRFTGNIQGFYNPSYTAGSDGSGNGNRSHGKECVDAHFGSIVGLVAIGTGYDPATDPGVNCASGCGSSSMPSGGYSGFGGGGGGGGGGWGDGGGGGHGHGHGDGGGGSSGGGDSGGGGGGGGCGGGGCGGGGGGGGGD